jgi:hypothetical protein
MNSPNRLLRLRASKLGFELVEKLEDIAKDPGASPAARVAAINAILDRGFGRPSQDMKLSGAVGAFDASKLSTLSDEEVEVFVNLLRKISGGLGDTD